MIARPVAFFLCLGAVGALAFEAGRRTPPKTDATAISEQPAPFTPTEAVPVPEVSTPVDVKNLARLPFAESCKALKSATPETIASWIKTIQEIKPSPTRAAALTSLFKTLIQIDPALAAQVIKQLKKEARWVAVMTVKDAAPPRAMEHVVDLLRTFPGEETSGCGFDLVRDAIEEWSAFDPIAVSRYLDENHENAGFFHYCGPLVRRWAAYDPEGAREWAAQALQRASTIEEVDADWILSSARFVNALWIEGYLEHDRAAALDYVAQFQRNRDVATAIPSVARALFLESPDEARAFVLRLDEKSQIKALKGIDGTADRVVHHDGDDWKTVPKYVAEWMLEFPQAIWEPAIGTVLSEWHDANLGDMFAWIAQLPPGTRQIVANKYRPYLGEETLAKEFGEVIQVPDIPLRDQLLVRFMKAAKDSKTGTLALLQTAPLSEEQKSYYAALIPDTYEPVETTSDDE